ncbi:HAD family hydrolase [Evansella cellulosilytica]|uniref:HAD-superfamily subfamily IB hydrolase, TIGR01490 n=1 Tax=Evansella cellulosilytica (strain ATCC 21833 / DSM 2522 / FERM P-1141 / JCM 9156 / N-4) TaxID=649639 RepID=E6TTG4_EVAC2|nr:HAD-IB family hydrolase [Evansella cellulosilytica]ADU29600.1 HAD-superfamily subfamily IB hydrolase, TIGR01490 [Evansella cellulosilytica DSM 2522]
MKVAIFDFDGTLFPKETFPLMMKHLKTHPVHKNKYRKFIGRLLPVYIAYKCKLYREKKMKEYSMKCFLSSLGTIREKEVEQFFEELAAHMKENLDERVIKKLEAHRKEGYYIMLVSGAFEPLLYAVTENITFDRIIGTVIPYKENKLNVQAPISHVNGERKKEKILEALIENEVDWQNSFAYGDSYSDLDVLQLVGNAVAVQPEPRLLEVAKKMEWEIIS